MIPELKWIDRFRLESGQWVHVPSESARTEGLRLVANLKAAWRPPRSFFHLRKGGHVAALCSHQGGRFFVHLDIANFFGAIGRSRVTRELKPFFGYTEARRIAKASTVRDPVSGWECLPFGFVQSPMLASLCLAKSRLGTAIARWNSRSDVNVTVYMDDIIISAADFQAATACKTDLEQAAELARFWLNPGKTEGPAQHIVAFNVDLRPDDLRVCPERFREFVDVVRSEASEDVVKGSIGYVRTVNPSQAADLEVLHEEAASFTGSGAA